MRRPSSEPAQPRRRRQRHRSALALTNRQRGGDPSGGTALAGDKIEHDRRRVVVAKRVRYLPDAAATVRPQRRLYNGLSIPSVSSRRARTIPRGFTGSSASRRSASPGSPPGRPSPRRDRPPPPRTAAARRRGRRKRRSREGCEPAAAGCGGRATGQPATRWAHRNATHGRSRSADRGSLGSTTLSRAEQTRHAAKPIGRDGGTGTNETRRPPSREPRHHGVRRRR